LRMSARSASSPNGREEAGAPAFKGNSTPAY
jgi:hypothetical protein